MPRITPLILSVLLSISVHAQFTSLSDQEITRLRTHIQNILLPEIDFARASLDSTPHPIDTIRSEGLLMGNPRKTATRKALTDMRKIYALALAWRITQDKRYLDKADVYLKAWATQNTPNGDPIDDTNLDGAIEGYDLVKKDLPKEDEKSIRDWLFRTASIEVYGPRNKRSNDFNNWHSHRLKIVGEIAFAIGDTALQSYTIAALQKQIEKNITPEGSSIDFAARDALHYQVYDLEPLIRLAIVLKRATGVDYYTWSSPTGSSLKLSVAWTLPYLDGRQTHPEFVNSKVQFDRDRAKNNEAAYQPGKLFDPFEGASMLLLAGYFDHRFLDTSTRLYATRNTAPPLMNLLTAKPGI